MRRMLLPLALAGALAVAVPGPAMAAESAVEYSLDGVTWSATPPASVFPVSWQPVPGSEATATLHLRAVRPGHTVVGVYSGSAASSDPVLLAGTTVTDAAGRTSRLDVLATDCSLVAPQAVLAQGQSLTVPLTVAISPTLTQAQNATLRLSLLIDLSDTGVPTLASGCPVDARILAAFPGSGTSAMLGRTGTEPAGGPVVAGAALLVGGVAALVLGRRRARRLRS